MHVPATSRAVKGLGAVVLGAGLAIASAPAASAHVSATPETTSAGEYTTATFSVPHGCADKATTKVSIEVPDVLEGATPTVNPNWEISTKHFNGDKDDYVTEVEYKAKTPLKADQRDTFELSFYIPPSAEGELLAFPTVQECGSEKAKWVEIPEAGQSEEDLEMPAPAFEVTATEAEADSSDSTDGSTTVMVLSVLGVLMGGLGLILGGVAFARTRKKS